MFDKKLTDQMKGSVKRKLMGMEDKYARVESTELDIKK